MTQRKVHPRQANRSSLTSDSIGTGDLSDALFRNIGLPILWLDNDQRLRGFTGEAAKIFQITPSDNGVGVSSLKEKIPGLSELAEQFIRTGQSLETETQCRQGRWYSLRIRPFLAANGSVEGAMVIFIDIDQAKRSEAELKKLNKTLMALFQSAPDAIVTVDADGLIIRVNNQTELMFGYSSLELHGKKIELLMPTRFRAAHLQDRAGYIADPKVRMMGANLDLYGRRKDGTEFPIDIMLSPLQTPAGRSVIATIRDITERKRAEEALRKADQERALLAERTAVVAALEARSRQYRAVANLSQRALEGLDLTTLLEDAVKCIPQVLEVEFCKMLELSPDRKSLLLRAGVGWKSDHAGQTTVAAGPKSQAGFALLSSSPIIVEDLRTEKRFRASPLLLKHGAVSGISVIIHARARPYGVLEAHSTQQRHFTADDIHFLQSVAGILAAAIERRGLEEELLGISNREQRRIGQDLHDGLSQQLAGIEFRNSVLVQQLSDNPSGKAEAVTIGKLLRDAMQETRTLARGLSPVHLEANGLMSALAALAANTEKVFDIGCHFTCSQPVLMKDNAVATHLYRIAQEATSNAIKHGRANAIIVSLNDSGGELRLTIADRGCGFTPEKGTIDGMGLRIMRYRAELIGGTLDIDSTTGNGTTIVCQLKSNR